jgi:hypothetical protein
MDVLRDSVASMAERAIPVAESFALTGIYGRPVSVDEQQLFLANGTLHSPCTRN